eukprot:GHVP01067450.1.p1 GENE.GHVP01067450.1~~GHVP01067450.1.p1  ORF type:complete len:809 (+),score=105.93 GHVP01067450.1:1113-3539(+)
MKVLLTPDPLRMYPPPINGQFYNLNNDYNSKKKDTQQDKHFSSPQNSQEYYDNYSNKTDFGRSNILEHYRSLSRDYRNNKSSSGTREQSPLVEIPFLSVDNGKSLPTVARNTTGTIYKQYKLSLKKQIPIGTIFTPFSPEEGQVPVIDYSNKEVQRCRRCKAFPSPYCRFIKGGRVYLCAICNVDNEIEKGVLENIHTETQMLAFNHGTYDIIPSNDFIEKGKNKQNLLFILDCSRRSVKAGVLNSSLRAIAKTVSDATFRSLYSKIGIITFDNSFQVYNINREINSYTSTVITDIEYPLLIKNDYLFDITEEGSVALFIELLKAIETDFMETIATDSCLESVILFITNTMNIDPSMMIIFSASPPSSGIHTDEKAKKRFYDKTIKEIASRGITISLFTFYNNNEVLNKIGGISEATGGVLRHYPEFHYDKDSEVVSENLLEILKTTSVFNSVAKVRCGTGLDVEEIYGNINKIASDEFSFGSSDNKKSFCVKFKQPIEIPTETVNVQLVILYTRMNGDRRIRIINTGMDVSNNFLDVFNDLDSEAIAGFISKTISPYNAAVDPSFEIENIQLQITSVLAAFKQNISHSESSSVKLHLPESLKTLPMLVLSLIKSDALNIYRNPDLRYYTAYTLKDLPIVDLFCFLYPPIIPLSSILQSPSSNILDIQIELTIENIRDDDIYFLLHPAKLMVLVGKGVQNSFIIDIFGADSLDRLDFTKSNLRRLENSISGMVFEVITPFIYRSSPKIIRKGIDRNLEQDMYFSMVEDKTISQPSYTGYIDILKDRVFRDISDLNTLYSKAVFMDFLN